MGDSEKNAKNAPEKKEKPVRKTSFLQGVKAEFKKIIWPDKEKLVKETTAVVIITVILSIIIAAIDAGFKMGADIIFKIG